MDILFGHYWKKNYINKTTKLKFILLTEWE